MFNAKTPEKFIEDAIKVHGNKYDYTNSNYVHSMKEVEIFCNEHQCLFKQMPKTHLRGGVKCKECLSKTRYSLSQKEFIEKAHEKHGDIYDYSLVKYKNYSSKIEIICKTHGKFIQMAGNHLQGHHCQQCSSIKYTNETFLQKAREIHGDTYDYSLVDFVNIDTPVSIICKEHGEFKTTGKTHIKGSICKKCVLKKQSEDRSFTSEQFIEKARIVHGDKYDYNKTNYVNIRTKIVITCKTHGDFLQKAHSHIYGCGCRKCAKNSYSQVSIRWLSFMSKYDGVFIQHAENDGEFSIPNTKMKADGYCKETNTIYEFHGTMWHGDPRVYKADKISHIGIPFGDLYQKTLKREKTIKEMGYNYKIIWEKDWNNIIRSVKLIQNNFRKKYIPLHYRNVIHI
jgi:hypothetical protein